MLSVCTRELATRTHPRIPPSPLPQTLVLLHDYSSTPPLPHTRTSPLSQTLVLLHDYSSTLLLSYTGTHLG